MGVGVEEIAKNEKKLRKNHSSTPSPDVLNMITSTLSPFLTLFLG